MAGDTEPKEPVLQSQRKIDIICFCVFEEEKKI